MSDGKGVRERCGMSVDGHCSSARRAAQRGREQCEAVAERRDMERRRDESECSKREANVTERVWEERNEDGKVCVASVIMVPPVPLSSHP
jgi:hypothetical protein